MQAKRSSVKAVSVCVDGVVYQRRVCCPHDSYECFRNLCCYSRFYHPFCCSRFIVKTHFLHTPRLIKSGLRSVSQ